MTRLAHLTAWIVALIGGAARSAPPTPALPVIIKAEPIPEWNARFARTVEEFPNHHRPLNEHLDLAAILCHVEERVIGNDYTLSFAGRRYPIQRSQVQAGMPASGCAWNSGWMAN